MERRKKLLVRGVWTEPEAGLDLRDTPGDAAINDGLGREHDLSVLGLCLEHIADGDAGLLPQVLRDDDLVLVLDGDDGLDV